MELKKYVKSRLPGGFAAQKIIGTGRRKCAIARVVLQEGTGKVIINYRDAKVSNIERVFCLQTFWFFFVNLEMFLNQSFFAGVPSGESFVASVR